MLSYHHYLSVHQMSCVLVYGLLHSMLEEKQDLYYLLKRMHFFYEMLGVNQMLELKSSVYNIHTYMFKPTACTFGSEGNEVTYLSSRYHLSFPRAKDQNSIFISHPLFSNLLSFSHFSFMNMFIPITMIIANFSLLLSCLISLTCGQLFIIGDELLNSAITKLHASVPQVHAG